jgi:hypothetical protein
VSAPTEPPAVRLRTTTLLERLQAVGFSEEEARERVARGIVRLGKGDRQRVVTDLAHAMSRPMPIVFGGSS